MLTLFSRATIHRRTIWSWLQQPRPTPRQQIPPDSNYFSNTLSNSYVETPKVIVTAGHISLWCSPHSVDDEHLITVRGSVEVSHDHKNKNDATTYTNTQWHHCTISDPRTAATSTRLTGNHSVLLRGKQARRTKQPDVWLQQHRMWRRNNSDTASTTTSALQERMTVLQFRVLFTITTHKDAIVLGS